MPRITPLGLADAPEEIAEHYERVFGKGRDPIKEPGTSTGSPGTWHTVWARTPGILKAFQAYSIASSKIASQLRELALMRTGYLCESQFVYSQHCKGARMVGVGADKIAAIPYWEVAGCYDAVERLVLAYTDAILLQRGRVHGHVVRGLVAALGEDTVLELSFFIKSFDMHATNCRALRLEYDDVPERIVEIPAPDQPGVQDWHDRKWANAADQG